MLARPSSEGAGCAYHALNGLVYLADGELQGQTEGLLVRVLVDDLLQEVLSLSSITTLLDAGLAIDLGVLVDDAQTDDLIAIIGQFVDQPFEGELGIIVLIGAAEEGPRTTGVLIIRVLAVQGQGEVTGVLVVEGIKGYARLKVPEGRRHDGRLAKRIW